MKHLLIVVFLVICLILSTNGSERLDTKTKLKQTITKKTSDKATTTTQTKQQKAHTQVHDTSNVVQKLKNKALTVNANANANTKTTTNAHAQAHVAHSAHAKTVARDPAAIIKPDMDTDTANILFNWFYPNYGNPDLNEACRDLAFCMMNEVHWGSHVMNYVPQNFPTDLGDIKDELKDIVERVIADENVYQSVKNVVANNFKTSADLCQIPEAAPSSGICQTKGCYQIYGYPAIKAPGGDATKTTTLGCSANSDCTPDTTCQSFGGTPICEHYKLSSNTCRCMWVMDQAYAQRLCGKDVSALDTFDCAGGC